MSQRHSGYDRIPDDRYETPEWVTRALLPHVSGLRTVWEPAAGNGKMVRALEDAGMQVLATDISQGQNFLTAKGERVDAIITNPPYRLAQAFIEHALRLMSDDGLVAMLLRTDYDHAKTRRHLFADCQAFHRKIVLTKRIRWIEGSTGSPSFNHAWYIWDGRNAVAPVISYDIQLQNRETNLSRTATKQ